MKSSFKYRILCIVLTALVLSTSGYFVYLLNDTQFLPIKYILIIAAAFLGFTAIIFALSFDCRKKWRSAVAIILALLIPAGQFFAADYISAGKETIENIITEPDAKEISEIMVFVKNEDPAQTLEDTKDYTFGILDIQDREATDYVVNEINQKLGTEIKTKQYSGVEELMNMLLYSKEIDAFILNDSFLDLLADIEEYAESEKLIRAVYVVTLEDEAVIAETNPENHNVFTVYLSGIDTKGHVTRKSRSDTNILATVNVQTGQILLVSTPRDYFVPLSISNGVPDKLTHAGIYGISVSRDTLASIYDTPIDYYFRVNFDGFKDIIDALGGVTVMSDYDFTTGPNTYVKGKNYLNGAQALAFARNRYSFAGGDRQRGKHQMAVIKGVVEKASGPAILIKYKSILAGLEGTFETNMPYEKVARLVQNQLENGTKWNVQSYSVDGTGTYKKPYSMSTTAYVMIPDQATIDKAKSLINQVKNGEVPQI